MSYADESDVRKRLGRALTEFEQEQVAEWLADLSSDIRLRVPDVEARIQASEDYARTVRRVIGETVVEKLKNPEGLRQRTVSVDDYSETKTVDVANSSGRLIIRDEDWVLLLPATSGDAFSIRAVATPGFAPGVVVPW